MHPYTETWKPAWRGLHRAGCVLAVGATLLVVIVQSGWMSRAFVYPHRLLKMSIGASHWTAITTGFHDSVTFRGGRRVWNLYTTASQADELRARCGEATSMTLIDERPLRVILVEYPPGTDVDVHELAAIARSDKAEKKAPPQGCLLGSERDREGKSGSQAALFGHVIQIEEWVD